MLAFHIFQLILSLGVSKMDIKQMDQTNWVCYKFGDTSYYYGEAGLLDSTGIVHPKDNADIAAEAKLVKHGFGIYIYDDPEGKVKYEGYFEKDKKSGKGKMVLKDGSVYEGQFRQNQYHDNGTMKFSNGDLYDGKWKKGRMDGPGLFKRADGLSLKGSFKNNYFLDGNVLRNPFVGEGEYEALKKKRKQIQKQYQKNQKAKNGYFIRVQSGQFQKINQLLKKSWCNNRIPLIIAAEEANKSIDNFCDLLNQHQNKSKIVDLRKFHKSSPEQKHTYKKSVSEMFRHSICEGQYVILSLDDSPNVEEFDDFFYPEIKQLYEPNGFNPAIWAPRDLKKPEIKDKIIGNAQVNENYGFLVWSKVKISQKGISDDLIQQKVQKRFDSILPYIKIDLIFLVHKEEPPKQQQE